MTHTFRPIHLSRVLVQSLSMLSLLGGCSGSSAENEEPVEAVAKEAPPVIETTSGALLTIVEVGPDHAVEFYALEGGGIAVGERVSLDAPDAERLDLEALGALGLGQMFRTLVGDDAAAVPQPLLDAEARREKQLTPQNLLANAALPVPQLRDQAEGSVAAWAMDTRSHSDAEIQRTSQALTADELWFLNTYCPSAEVDATWCPTNAQSWAQTGWRETMFYDIHGLNAASSGNAVFTVDTWNPTSNAWQQVLARNLSPRTGYRWLFYNVGYYKSRVEGSLIHLAERFRLSQPSVSFVSTYPSDAGQSFYNDIQGFKHDADNWYLSRTQYGFPSGGSQYGQLAKVPVGRSLASAPQIVATQPKAWKDAGFPHYGDVAFAGGRIFVPMEGGSGCSVGVFDTNLAPIGRAFLRSGGCPFLAYNPKNGLFYTGSNQTLEAYNITVNGASVTSRLDRTLTLSTNVGAITGADFSAKGNLWVYTQFNESWGVMYGIDGFSGIVQTQVNVERSGSDESEGLTLWDLDADTRAPGMRGQIHIQDLSNDALSDDDLYVRHYRVSDVRRL